MKVLILVAAILSASAAHAAAPAEVASLPTAIPSSVLGGEVLLLHKKPAIVINGRDNALILKELGETGRKAFYKDIIMERSVDSLLSDYARTDHPATHAVIWRYESAQGSTIGRR